MIAVLENCDRTNQNRSIDAGVGDDSDTDGAADARPSVRAGEDIRNFWRRADAARFKIAGKGAGDEVCTCFCVASLIACSGTE